MIFTKCINFIKVKVISRSGHDLEFVFDKNQLFISEFWWDPGYNLNIHVYEKDNSMSIMKKIIKGQANFKVMTFNSI